MSLFAKLFRKPVDPETAQNALINGCAKLWMREFAEARTLLDLAARGHPRPALPLAYLSLLNRMQGDLYVPAAIKLARQAIKEDEACFEALAALAMVALHADELIMALQIWRSSRKTVPFDVEGHHLGLVLYLLFQETMVEAVETKDGMQFNFRPEKPLTRGALRLLDGYPEVAKRDFASTELIHYRSLGAGLASWRFVARQHCLQRERNQTTWQTIDYTTTVQSFEEALRSIGSFPGDIDVVTNVESSINQLLTDLKLHFATAARRGLP